MLTKDQFDAMPLIVRVQKIFESGVEIMSRTDKLHDIKLYAFSDFFVEIWYQQTINRIEKVVTQDLDEVIQLYENQIDIHELFKK